MILSRYNIRIQNFVQTCNYYIIDVGVILVILFFCNRIASKIFDSLYL